LQLQNVLKYRNQNSSSILSNNARLLKFCPDCLLHYQQKQIHWSLNTR